MANIVSLDLEVQWAVGSHSTFLLSCHIIHFWNGEKSIPLLGHCFGLKNRGEAPSHLNYKWTRSDMLTRTGGATSKWEREAASPWPLIITSLFIIKKNLKYDKLIILSLLSKIVLGSIVAIAGIRQQLCNFSHKAFVGLFQYFVHFEWWEPYGQFFCPCCSFLIFPSS